MRKSDLIEGIKDKNFHWFGIFLLFLIFFFFIVGSVVAFANLDAEKFITLPLGIHAMEKADYSAEINENELPAVKVSIIRDVLYDQKINLEEIELRIGKVIEQLSAPVPVQTEQNAPIDNQSKETEIISTPMFSPTITATVLISTSTQTRTLTNTPSLTNTQIVIIIPTRTSTKTATITPSKISTITLTNTQSFITTSTNTPTPTPTNTATNTPTPTDTATPTPTDTATPTPTDTATPTPTDTATPTPTDTATPTPTDTATPTPTDTATPTPTDTATPTPTDTATPTPTDTATPTPTDTATPTPTDTATPTPTDTATPTPTDTATPTPTDTATPTPTDTATPTPTDTATPTPTNTATNTPTPTATISSGCVAYPSSGFVSVRDTYIDKSNANKSYGSDTEIRIRPTGDVDKRGLVYFDLSSIPPGSTVQSAYLYLTVTDDKEYAVVFYRITESWVESVTWNNSPPFDTTPVGGFTITKNKCTHVSNIDQSLITNWINAPATNYGVYIYPPSGSGDAIFSSREGLNPPILVVDFIPPSEPDINPVVIKIMQEMMNFPITNETLANSNTPTPQLTKTYQDELTQTPLLTTNPTQLLTSTVPTIFSSEPTISSTPIPFSPTITPFKSETINFFASATIPTYSTVQPSFTTTPIPTYSMVQPSFTTSPILSPTIIESTSSMTPPANLNSTVDDHEIINNSTSILNDLSFLELFIKLMSSF